MPLKAMWCSLHIDLPSYFAFEILEMEEIRMQFPQAFSFPQEVMSHKQATEQNRDATFEKDLNTWDC